MELFERGDRDREDASNSRPSKIPRQDIPSGLQMRKAALDKFASKGYPVCVAGPSTTQTPAHPKPPLGKKPSSDDKTEKDPNPPHLNRVAQRFGVQLQPTNRGNDGKTGSTKFPIKTSDPAKEDPKPLHPKPAWNKFVAPPDKEKNPQGAKPDSNFALQESEAKPQLSKVAVVKEKLWSMTQEDPKPLVSKPPLAQKPSFNKKFSCNEDTSNKSGFPQRLSGSRTNIHALQEAKEIGENSRSAAEAAGSHFPNIALKPTGHRSSLSKGTPKNVKENTEEEGMSAAKNIFHNKIIQEESGSSYKLHRMNTAFAAGRPSGGSQEKENEVKSSEMPKQRNLPPVFKLRQPPEKPNRPPTVQLENWKSSQKNCPKNEGLKQIAPSSAAFVTPIPPSHSAMELPPPPPSSHPFLQVSVAPSLPPRNIKPSSETIGPDNEENYDDVEFVSQGHGNTRGGQESDVEMYEDINDIRSLRRKEKKQDKEDKRRMDQEKKERKEKEKKEQELRKKFKLTGPIEVLHEARACVDHKGGKNELSVKQGDMVEIIRITDNPEGKWLGRIKGCCGYIKTTMVKIDYDTLKRKQQPSTRAVAKHTDSDQEMYDDVGEQDTTSSQSGDQRGCGNTFPSSSDQDIYDGIDEEDTTARSVSQDEDKNGIWSWGILKRLKVKDDKKKSVREKTTKGNEAEENENLFMSSSTKESGKDYGDDVYDDIDSSEFPPPPPDLSSSKSASFGKPKSDENNVQKLKIMEKEEKEFRKKFKFDGEIKVLYSTTTVQDLPQKRWGYKDLQIKPGESLDIIESTDDTKVLCRNEEGKYGYVLRSYLVQNDGEIYDDIGDDCIYDNSSDAEFS